MIMELEFLEQVLGGDWTLARAIVFLSQRSADPWPILKGLWGDRKIEFTNSCGIVLKEWQVEALLRDQKVDSKSMVRVTEAGAMWAT